MTATHDASTDEPQALLPEAVIGGVDTHADTIHVALCSVLGRDLVDQEFATTPAGYADAIEFLSSHGAIHRVGIEGTSSYGVGLTRAARAAGLEVTEVNRPDRAERRRIGKSDPIDAYQAAHAVLSGRATSAPKTEQIDALRALHVARRSAVKARTAAMNQIHQLLVTAPAATREKYRALKEDALVSALARCRPTTGTTGDLSSKMVLTALKAIAQRHEYLSTQADELRREITVLVHAANPGLLATHGVGPDTAAQLLITAGGNPDRLSTEASFAALCGTAPVPASSGKITRHRLARGGDRAANSALHTIALVRMSSGHPQTKAFVARHRHPTHGKQRTSKEILRMLKRAIAREIFKHLTRPVTVPAIDDLRDTRRAKNITTTRAATALGVWPATISQIEHGTRRNDDFAHRYREWLLTA